MQSRLHAEHEERLPASAGGWVCVVYGDQVLPHAVEAQSMKIAMK